MTALRDLLYGVYPDAEETLKWNQPVFVVDGQYRFYIACYAEHANLGFFRGTSTADTDGLLEGTGKKMRHVSFVDAADVEDPAVRALVERAA